MTNILKNTMIAFAIMVGSATTSVAYTAVGEVVNDDALKDAPYWQMIVPGKGDYHWDYSRKWLIDRELSDKYLVTSVMDEIKARNPEANFVKDKNGFWSFVSGETYLLPVATAEGLPVAPKPLTQADLDQFEQQQNTLATRLDLAETVIVQQGAKVTDNAASIDVLADWTESNTERVDGLEEQLAELSARLEANDEVDRQQSVAIQRNADAIAPVADRLAEVQARQQALLEEWSQQPQPEVADKVPSAGVNLPADPYVPQPLAAPQLGAAEAGTIEFVPSLKTGVANVASVEQTADDGPSNMSLAFLLLAVVGAIAVASWGWSVVKTTLQRWRQTRQPAG